MDESSDIIAITPAACKKDIDKEWSKSEIELWEKFLKELKDQDYVNSYREYIVMLKEKTVNKTIATEDLEKKGYEAWEEDEEKKLCWLEAVKILKVCGHEDIVNSNPSVLQVLYIDRLIRNGFIKEEEEEIVSAIERKNVCKPVLEEEQKEENVHTVPAVVNETDLKNKKRNDGHVANNVAINVVATASSVTPQIAAKGDDLEMEKVIAEQKESVLGDLQILPKRKKFPTPPIP
jgi:hypothetical protein